MTRYLSLAEYVWLAEQVTGIDAATLAKAGRLELADSAMHAPAAGFGETATLAVAAHEVDEDSLASWFAREGAPAG